MRFDARPPAARTDCQILEVDGIGAADRERNAVHDQRKALAHTFQVMQRLAAGNQIIFRDDLEPIDGDEARLRWPRSGVCAVQDQSRRVSSKWGPGMASGPAVNARCGLLRRARPWPSPGQRRIRPSSSIHSPDPCSCSCPCSCSSPTCTRRFPYRNSRRCSASWRRPRRMLAVLIPEVNNMAAAAAIVALDNLLICIIDPLNVLDHSGIAAHVQDPANARHYYAIV